MAVTLRLARHGRKGVPFYRIVASRKGAKRDGEFIEIVGTFSPTTEPAQVTLKEDILRKWIGVGAQITPVVRDIVIKKVPGLVEEIEKTRLNKLQASRKSRKARQKKEGKSAAPKSAKAKKS